MSTSETGLAVVPRRPGLRLPSDSRLDGRRRGRGVRPAEKLRKLEREQREEEDRADDDEDLLLALACRACVCRGSHQGVLPAAVVPVDSSASDSSGSSTGATGPS